jgi:hypothetical protein
MSLARATAEAIERVGGDPSDLLWEWLTAYGPHGSRFTWAQTRQEAPGYIGFEHLEQVVAEREAESPGYRMELRNRVRLGLASSDERLLQRCVQVSSVVGGRDELDALITLSAAEGAVGPDARAAAFYLRRRLKRGNTNAE